MYHSKHIILNHTDVQSMQVQWHLRVKARCEIGGKNILGEKQRSFFKTFFRMKNIFKKYSNQFKITQEGVKL